MKCFPYVEAFSLQGLHLTEVTKQESTVGNYNQGLRIIFELCPVFNLWLGFSIWKRLLNTVLNTQLKVQSLS